jgi:hypothetical protein
MIVTAGPKLPICWRHENVRKAISIKAKTDDKQTHYFLACHSPMSFIQDVKSKRQISEEDLFKNISTSSQRDKQVVIYGEPGTGKSHLVHWLKLRFDYGKENGELGDIVPVLIERRSGSLKDALTQLIEQLGEDFRKYLDPVQQALEKLSAATARQMLANELSLELGPRWSDRGREKIDKRLKHLGQACRAEGFGGWLCRDGGVIDRTIALLVQTSDLKDRENAPKFQPEDLLVKDRYRTKRTNSEEVLSLIDELDDSKAIRELAAECLNDALSNSIRDMVGLSGANLRGIFDSIRGDLNRVDKQLALFIEDVSAMSELDVEIVNALEPQDRVDLCPMTAVLGMTHTGFAKLRDNQKQRIEFIYRVDGETTSFWSRDKDNLSRFIARYLNAIRLDEEQVRQIANDRRASNSDVSTSRCTDCPAREECHAVFGSVNLGDTAVGLYPFTSETAPNVLELIRRDETSSESPNQRGLLMRLLIPVMSDVASLEQSIFPNVSKLPVHVTDPYYWTEFRQSYLGDYSDTELSRIRALAGIWIEQTDEVKLAAATLQRFLEPLGLPRFVKEVAQEKPTNKPIPKGKDLERSKPDKSKDEIKKFLDSLSEWVRGEILTNSPNFRDWLSALIKSSIRWENYLQPAQFLEGTWKDVKGRDFIKIEGQPEAPGRVWFEFPRNEETRALLEALCRFEKEGRKSWDFSFGEAHKRTVANWLRKYEKAIVATLDPPVDRNQAVKTAVQVTSLIAVVRDRCKLPQRSVPELVNALFKPKWITVPKALSKEWGMLLNVLDSRYKQVVDFLKNEISIRQGDGGVNFICPNSLIEYASEFNSDLKVNDLEGEYFQSFWKSRYSGLPSQSSPERERFEGLRNAIDSERMAISNGVGSIRNQLQTVGFAGADLKVEVQVLCDQVIDLVETVKKAKVALPDVEFDTLVKDKTFTERKMSLANAVARAEKVASSQDPFDVLTFDSTDLVECQTVLSVVSTRVKRLDAYIMEQEDLIKRDGDPSAFAQKMFDSLRVFSELSEEDASEAQDVDVT